MRVRAEPLWIPKKGNEENEYEDAFWPENKLDAEAHQLRFAVADGATESCYPARWAQVLVRAAGEGKLLPSPAEAEVEVARLRAEWREWISPQTFPWYVEEKVRQGTFAALVLLVLEESPTRSDPKSWQAMALGDSCLIHIRGERILKLFPIERSEDFSNRPYLLGSLSEKSGTLTERLRITEGTWQAGDSFFLMSDALACWFIREAEEGSKPWEAIRSLAPLGGGKPFPEWIENLRVAQRLRNDDCTLLHIEIS